MANKLGTRPPTGERPQVGQRPRRPAGNMPPTEEARYKEAARKPGGRGRVDEMLAKDPALAKKVGAGRPSGGGAPAKDTFGEDLFGQTATSHEAKLALSDLANKAKSGNPNDVRAFHEALYTPGGIGANIPSGSIPRQPELWL